MNKTIFKRLISFVISIIMLFALSNSVFVSAEANSQVEYDAGKESYNFLKALGIVSEDDGAYNGEALVNRAYFVKLALMLSNDAPGALVSEDKVFFDVNSSTPYEKYIETAFRIGYISGGSNGYFNPGDNITYAQALKIIINILGYTSVAEAKGGFPAGYMSVAGSLDISDGINVDADGFLNQSQVMILLENASKCDIMKIASIGDPTEYITNKGETILTEKHKINFVESVIEANAYTDLIAQDSGLMPGEVSLGGKIFAAGKSDAENLLGYNAEVYYDSQSNKSAPEILYAREKYNTVWECDDSQNIEISGKYINLHTDSSTIKRISVSPSVTYILNGKMAVYDINSLTDVYGKVTFISNDSDKMVDVINITDYSTYVVSGVSPVSKIVATKDGSRIELDSDNDEYSFEIKYYNGTPVEFKDIKEDDVLLVAQSTGAGLNKKEVLLSDVSLTGVLSEISEEYVVIDGQKYSIDSSVLNKAKTGTSYKYLTDAKGRIAYIYALNDVVYGYIYGAMVQSGVGGKILCKIFTENDRWVELAFKNKFKFNGKMINASEVLNPENLGSDFESQRQLVRYNVNSKAEITMMETAKTILIDSSGEDEAIENDVFRISYKPSGSVSYRSNSRTFNGDVFVDAGAKIFVIPDDYDVEGFDVITRSNLIADMSYSNITVYDLDEFLNAKVITVNTVTKAISSSSKFMIVKSIGMMQDSNGASVPSVRGWWNGTELAFPVKISNDLTAETVNGLAHGDVIQFTYNEEGEMDKVQKYTSLSGGAYYEPVNFYYNFSVIGGVVDECDYSQKRIKLYYTNTNKWLGLAVNSSAVVTIYDSATKTVTTGTLADITKNDKIVAKMSYYVVSEIVVVR